MSWWLQFWMIIFANTCEKTAVSLHRYGVWKRDVFFSTNRHIFEIIKATTMEDFTCFFFFFSIRLIHAHRSSSSRAGNTSVNGRLTLSAKGASGKARHSESSRRGSGRASSARWSSSGALGSKKRNKRVTNKIENHQVKIWPAFAVHLGFRFANLGVVANAAVALFAGNDGSAVNVQTTRLLGAS